MADAVLTHQWVEREFGQLAQDGNASKIVLNASERSLMVTVIDNKRPVKGCCAHIKRIAYRVGQFFLLMFCCTTNEKKN